MQLNFLGASKEYDDLFSLFWEECPKKRKKPMAYKSWKRAVLNTDPKEIIEGMKRYKMSVLGEDQKFILHPTTFINNREWENFKEKEITEAEKEWDALFKFMKRYGRYGGSLPLSERGIQALRAIGGYAKICEATDAGIKKLEKEFYLLYNGRPKA